MRLTDEQCDEFRRLPLSFRDMVRAIYEAGIAEEQAAVAKWLDERGKHCEITADEFVKDHSACRKWEIRAHESFTSAKTIRDGRHK